MSELYKTMKKINQEIKKQESYLYLGFRVKNDSELSIIKKTYGERYKILGPSPSGYIALKPRENKNA